MKMIAYIVAGLAALGIMVALITTPTAEIEATGESANAASATSRLVTTTDIPSNPLPEPGTMTFDVPGMHCQFACFPKVKETLEGDENVSEVVLAEQPDPNALTVKKVIVKYEAGFDVDKVLASLEERGFTASPQM